jgi:hypothetical protein
MHTPARWAVWIAIGYLEDSQGAFAVLHADAAEAIVARKLGKQPNRLAPDRRRRTHLEVHRLRG